MRVRLALAYTTLDRAAGRCLEASDAAQGAGLAAAGRTQQGVELAALDIEAQPADRVDLAFGGAVPHTQILDLQHACNIP
jgi:hypothetical protein